MQNFDDKLSVLMQYRIMNDRQTDGHRSTANTL